MVIYLIISFSLASPFMCRMYDPVFNEVISSDKRTPLTDTSLTEFPFESII